MGVVGSIPAVDLTLTLHTMAGLGALAVGVGILLREPSRARNRQFALLCGALALWNLGLVGHWAAGPAHPDCVMWLWCSAHIPVDRLGEEHIQGTIGIRRVDHTPS